MPTKRPTKHAIILYNALDKRGIKSKLEDYDGYKHIDISIYWARLDIEIDGIQHLTNPEQINQDLKRAFHSLNDDMIGTIHVPNIFIETHLDKIADAIAQVARDRYEYIKRGELY